MWKQYLYIAHNIQKIQDLFSYIFMEIMFHALEHKDNGFYDVLKLPYKVLLMKVKSLKMGKQLGDLYKLFQRVSPEQIDLLRTTFVNNNQIEKLCRNEINPLRFEDLKKLYEGDDDWGDLLKAIKVFCVDMYSKYVYLKAFEDMYGTMDAYYKALVKNDSMCHCCGIGSVLTMYNTPRDAFDHYLPKSIYPFITLNFRNLVPTCPHCNSSYKHEIDTLYDKIGEEEKRTKAFLPFGIRENHISVKISFTKLYDKEKVEDCGMKISFSCQEKDEELQTWRRIYNIDEQYRAYCYDEENLSVVESLLLYYEHPEYIKARILEMERLVKVKGYFLRAAFTRAVCDSLNINLNE